VTWLRVQRRKGAREEGSRLFLGAQAKLDVAGSGGYASGLVFVLQ